MAATTLVVGIGNDMMGDDAAGLAVVRQLRAGGTRGDNVSFLEGGGDGAWLATLLAESRSVILIDAVTSGSPPGTLHCFDAAAMDIPAAFTSASSHLFSVPQAIALSRALGTLPARLTFYGIEVGSCAPGKDLSPAVAAAVNKAASAITEGLSSGQANPLVDTASPDA